MQIKQSPKKSTEKRSASLSPRVEDDSEKLKSDKDGFLLNQEKNYAFDLNGAES